MTKTAINTTKEILKISLIITLTICVALLGAYLLKIYTKSDKTQTSEQPVLASQPLEVDYHAKVIPPQDNDVSRLPIFHCEAGATCYSSDKATIHTIATTLDHLDPTTRYNYTLIVTKGSIDNISYRTQDDLIRTCSSEKLCIIRNDVQKGTMLKDLKRIGEGKKSVFFKYSLSIKKQIKMV